MRIRTLTLSAALIALPAAIAWTNATSPLRLQPTSRLWVTGTSTVRSFECKAKAFDAIVDAAVPNAVAAVLAGEKGVASVELKVPATQMDCNNGTMNEHMMKAIKGKEFADIVFKLDSYDVAAIATGAKAAIKGQLTLGGVTRDITFDADVKPAPDGAMVVAGVYALHMTEFNLKPPTLMLGTLKVKELVNVNFEITLKP
ncbi:MAG TPA: YceI family protein [Gemmatimonadaceae bacterium]|nr:YceI family protein [Gemmatimonadaceae bacterium]